MILCYNDGRIIAQIYKKYTCQKRINVISQADEAFLFCGPGLKV
jgi:hypothetical protein